MRTGYWSKSNLYEPEFIQNTMARDKFELALKFWHFSNSQEEHAGQGRLVKLKLLLNLFVFNGKSNPTTGPRHAETVVVDLMDDLSEMLSSWNSRSFFFTSISLAQHLLENDTYLVRMLRSCLEKTRAC